MNIAQFCIDRKVLTWTLSLAIFARANAYPPLHPRTPPRRAAAD